MSLRAWALLKLIPLMANFRDPARLAQAIRDNRATGPSPPPRRARKVFNFAEEDWETTRVLRMATHDGANPRKILYLHGGAYVFGIQAMQWAVPTKLLERLGGEVVTPLYPLAPEHDWRTGQQAVLRVYERLAAEHGAENIVVIGDSAGGGLALRLAQSLRATGSAAPSALVLFSPWLDLSLGSEDQPEIEKTDPALSIDFLRAAAALWARDVQLDDPRVSPLFGKMEGLPPTLVFSGTRDILDADAVRLAERAPSVVLKRYRGMFHVWPGAPIPEGRRAIEEAVCFIRQSTPKPS